MRVGASSDGNSDGQSGRDPKGVTPDWVYGTAAGNSRLPLTVRKLLLEFRIGGFLGRLGIGARPPESVARTAEFYDRLVCKFPGRRPHLAASAHDHADCSPLCEIGAEEADSVVSNGATMSSLRSLEHDRRAGLRAGVVRDRVWPCCPHRFASFQRACCSLPCSRLRSGWHVRVPRPTARCTSEA